MTDQHHRNFGVPNATARVMSGGQPPHGPHHRADTLRDSNSELATPSLAPVARSLGFESKTKPSTHSLAGNPPRLHLAVVRDSSFLQKHELNPVERLDAELDHREFAACVFWAVFITIVFGAPIAAATAFMSWS